ncbi:deoxyribodipyrimidine photo-lyase [Paraburkholderia sp. SUR17]|uniref:deoxyribodipyrimidine photo-lyase n=1 Tax=Paraburkholderia sp. SUR17 TaxID=3034358 RepID=UPI00240790FB|nr:deoxyribodipyrimidine photo-lyase [Paraburkholderia sp. SUR17]WEY37691.1 deoxyribodipyrimidine photo-lyase [Paraburkholderia sp. SUR17]
MEPGRLTLGGPAMSRGLIWFKRDLRVSDHAPLAAAARCDDAFALVVLEPEWLTSPECDSQHVAFLRCCVAALEEQLSRLGLPLLVRTGDMPKVLESLHGESGSTHLASRASLATRKQDRSGRTRGIGTASYPAPIVDERSALADAKARLYAMRRSQAAREEADAIQQRHGSRRSGLPASDRVRRRSPRQLGVQKELFE